jgi:adenylosuccinate lyase
MVQRAALAALRGAGDFRQLLAADTEVRSHLSAEALAAAFDLHHHLRHVDAIYRRVFPEDHGS